MPLVKRFGKDKLNFTENISEHSEELKIGEIQPKDGVKVNDSYGAKEGREITKEGRMTKKDYYRLTQFEKLARKDPVQNIKYALWYINSLDWIVILKILILDDSKRKTTLIIKI